MGSTSSRAGSSRGREQIPPAPISPVEPSPQRSVNPNKGGAVPTTSNLSPTNGGSGNQGSPQESTSPNKGDATPLSDAQGIDTARLPNARGGGGRAVGPGVAATTNLQSFLSSIGSGLQEQISTGFSQDFGNLESSLRGAADQRFDLRSADIRERLGGLGLRFGTDVSGQLARAGADVETDINAQLAPLAFQGQQGSNNLRAQGIFGGLQLPSFFQNLINAGETARLQPLTQAGAFGTGFAPVGNESDSKGGSILGG